MRIHVGYLEEKKIFADEDTHLLYLGENRDVRFGGLILNDIKEYPLSHMILNSIYLGDINDIPHMARVDSSKNLIYYYPEMFGYKVIPFHAYLTEGQTRIPLKEDSNRTGVHHFLFDYKNGEDVGIRIETEHFTGFTPTDLNYDDLTTLRKDSYSDEIVKFIGKPFFWFEAFKKACQDEGSSTDYKINLIPDKDYLCTVDTRDNRY